ncbi:MAG: hypothetical protein COA75_08190 [Cellvibrionales bacterium]|nr:MAG: hypothetical protein COA75_08190 [Cellvibrionales bacterium]
MIFYYPEVRLKLAARGVPLTLVHQIGRKTAFEVLTLCENIDAQKTLSFGMINCIVPDDLEQLT